VKKLKKLTLQKTTIRILTIEARTPVQGGMSSNPLCTQSTCHGSHATTCADSDVFQCG
jgi:hypothetical protein